MDQAIVLVMEEPRGPSQLIEIPVPNNSVTKVTLPDIQQLRSQVGQIIIIKALRLITEKVLTFSPILGLPNATLSELVKISLVLYCEGWQKAELIPILTLNDMADADSTAATTIPYRNRTTRFDNWKNVDWSKSYLQYSNGTLSSGEEYAVIMEAEYVKLDAQNQEIAGPS